MCVFEGIECAKCKKASGLALMTLLLVSEDSEGVVVDPNYRDVVG